MSEAAQRTKPGDVVLLSKIQGLITLAALIIVSLASVAPAAELDERFLNPPEATKPWCYWYWLNNDITKEGITADLEAMAAVGIKRAMIGNIEGGGPVKMFSPEWYDATRHAFREANRLGVELMPFNAPGWSQSGGSWIEPEQSMRRVSWHEFPARGGVFRQTVRPDGIDKSQDIAVVAVPRLDSVSVVGSAVAGSGGALQFAHVKPFTARALLVHGKAKGKLYAVRNGEREFVADVQAAGGTEKTDFLPNAMETFSFHEVTAQQFELVPNPGCRVVLTSEPTVAQVIEKQMGRMHPTPSPTWESYIFPDTVEPDDPTTVIKRKDILDLTAKLDADGELTCTLPEGDWMIIYFGMVTTGAKNSPAPPEATGLECDKMSRKHIEHHFNSMFGKLLEELTPAGRAAFKGITIDSYEKGAQNWTDGFADEFECRNGYSPVGFLPVMTGRVIDSGKASDQLLWDLRRTVADMIAENYVSGLRDVAHERGLTLWSENYGHWGFPGEFLVYGAHFDEIGGEFWSNQPLGTIECRAASSAAHIYGKRRAYAEAFTSSLDLGHHPYLFRARGEELFCEGVNHFVLHVYAHQPVDGVPGKNPWFGTAFHRNTPWFNEARDWVKYLQRCHYMLQQGEPVADVAVYIGDFAPQMTGPANPVPAGYDYDYIGSDAILRKLQVIDGQWVVYDEHDPQRIAARYRLLAMPKVKYINQLSHFAVDREFSLARHSHEYLLANPTWPTEWKQHSVMMAWADFMYTGNEESLAACYDLLQAEKTLEQQARADGLLDTQGLRDIVDWPKGERDGYDFRNVNTVVNAFHYENLKQMALLAEALGKQEDVRVYREKAKKFYRTFNEKLCDPERGLYVDGEGSGHASLHANMLPLAFGLVPEDRMRTVADFVVSKGMACSVYAAQYLMEGLYQAGRAEEAFALLTSRDIRSWYNMLRVGSTITLEAWDDRFKPNQDWNHAWGAVPGNIIPRYLLGVRPLEPGFEKTLIRPMPGPLARADATIPTIRGPLRVSLENSPDKPFRLIVSIPVNMTARVELPLPGGDGGVTVDGRPIQARVINGCAVIDDVGSGTHTFQTSSAVDGAE